MQLVTSIKTLNELLEKLQTEEITIGYVRVSTEQSHQDTSVLRQIDTLEKLGCQLTLVERESGTSTERQLYNQLIKSISLGKIHKIVTTRSDRLNRNMREMRYFYNLCSELGTEWHFIEEPELSSSSPWGVELRSQKAYEAQQESERIGRRQERAYLYAEESKRAIARKVIFGYRINSQRQYELDLALQDGSNAIAKDGGRYLASCELAQRLVDLYLEIQTIRGALKAWKRDLQALEAADESKYNRILQFTQSWLGYWLREPVLRGHMVYGKYKRELYGEKLEKKRYKLLPRHEWRIAYNTHPSDRLIDLATAKTIDKLLTTNENKGRAIAIAKSSPGTPKSLSSIMRCCRCKSRFNATGTYQKGKYYRYYYCIGRNEFKCKSEGVSEGKLRGWLMEAIVTKASQLTEAVEKASQGEVAIDSGQLKVLKSESQAAFEKYQQTGMSEFLALHKTFERKIENLEANLQADLEAVRAQETLLLSYSSVDFWLGLSNARLHDLLKRIVRDAWFDDGHLVSLDLEI
ncbi:recombinase family protein [Myxosarcina sp. GI1(2024)]